MDDKSPITVGDPRTNLPNIMFWRIHGWIEAKWKQFEASRRRSPAEDSLYQGFITEFRAHMLRMSDPVSPTSSNVVPTTTRGGATTRSTRTRRPASGRSLFGANSDLRRGTRRLRQDVNAVEQAASRVQGNGATARIMARLHDDLRTHHMRRNRVSWQVVFHVRPIMFRNRVHECSKLSTGTITPNCPQGPATRGGDIPYNQRGIRRGGAPQRANAPRPRVSRR